MVSVVKRETILAGQRHLQRQKWDYGVRCTQPGRPRMPGEIEAAVCRLAGENAWGYQRIRGKLLKLGIQRSKGFIANTLRRNGLPASPWRVSPVG